MRPLAGAALAIVCLAACSCSKTGPRPVYVLADRGPEGLDPHTSGTVFQTRNLLANVYESLVGFDDQLKLVPGLALS